MRVPNQIDKSTHVVVHYRNGAFVGGRKLQRKRRALSLLYALKPGMERLMKQWF